MNNEQIFTRLRELTEVGRLLALERDTPTLLEQILRSAQRLTRADGGSLYRLDETGQFLRFETVLNDSLGFWLGGTSGKPIPFPPLALYNEQGEPQNHSVVAYCAHRKQAVEVADAYTADGFDFAGAKRFDAEHHYRSTSFLTVPLLAHDGELLGVLQLVNARSIKGDVVPFASEDLAFVEALTAQAAVALENQLLVLRLEELFSRFANLISVAIDEKSKHTSGHCQRVPALTMLLAEAAAATSTGPLASFQMNDADRRELQLAGNLHDCGKITTPEYVLDKSTKLFGLNDRIDLIEARLEVLKSEKKLQAADRLLKGEEAARVAQWLETQVAILDADQAFLRKTNFGVEKMQEDDMQRVQQIAQKEWRAPNGERLPVLTKDEVDNLCIPYGTLTAGERQVINNHIVATIKMLESLPWPPHLKRVPEFAGGHHERMDGRGYPKGLTRDEMSVQARAMGIADIFEAITAKDRPYKKPNTISESLHILGKMALGGHIDPDLFDVFVRQKVYLRYAELFLDDSQIDEVDDNKIPGYQP